MVYNNSVCGFRTYIMLYMNQILRILRFNDHFKGFFIKSNLKEHIKF